MYVENCLQKMIKKDHFHFTGKYRGAAHNECNMNYKVTKNIPIVFIIFLHMIAIS